MEAVNITACFLSRWKAQGEFLAGSGLMQPSLAPTPLGENDL